MSSAPGPDRPVEGQTVRLGVDDVWGFALHDPATDTHTDSLLPDGRPEGDPRDALDCAARLHVTGIADTPIEDD